jgi:hypothetical protein
MRKGRRSAGFVEQILAGGGVKAGVFPDDLDSNIAVQNFVVGAIDDAHSTFADFGGDTTVAENLANHERAPLHKYVSEFQSFKVSGLKRYRSAHSTVKSTESNIVQDLAAARAPVVVSNERRAMRKEREA